MKLLKLICNKMALYQTVAMVALAVAIIMLPVVVVAVQLMIVVVQRVVQVVSSHDQINSNSYRRVQMQLLHLDRREIQQLHNRPQPLHRHKVQSVVVADTDVISKKRKHHIHSVAIRMNNNRITVAAVVIIVAAVVAVVAVVVVAILAVLVAVIAVAVCHKALIDQRHVIVRMINNNK